MQTRRVSLHVVNKPQATPHSVQAGTMHVAAITSAADEPETRRTRPYRTVHLAVHRPSSCCTDAACASPAVRSVCLAARGTARPISDAHSTAKAENCQGHPTFSAWIPQHSCERSERDRDERSSCGRPCRDLANTKHVQIEARPARTETDKYTDTLRGTDADTATQCTHMHARPHAAPHTQALSTQLAHGTKLESNSNRHDSHRNDERAARCPYA